MEHISSLNIYNMVGICGISDETPHDREYTIINGVACYKFTALCSVDKDGNKAPIWTVGGRIMADEAFQQWKAVQLIYVQGAKEHGWEINQL